MWLARRSRGKLAASVSPRQRRRTVNLCQLDFDDEINLNFTHLHLLDIIKEASYSALPLFYLS